MTLGLVVNQATLLEYKAAITPLDTSYSLEDCHRMYSCPSWPNLCDKFKFVYTLLIHIKMVFFLKFQDPNHNTLKK